MNSKEWLGQLSSLTRLPYYEEHRIFGDKSGSLVGVRDGFIVALGVGKAQGHAAVKLSLRYAKAPDPTQIKQALDPAKGKFKQVTTDETTASLVRFALIPSASQTLPLSPKTCRICWPR